MSSDWNSAQNRPHFPAMFHIPISGLKYLCAKYTFCFILIGGERLGGHHSEDTRDLPHHQEWEISPRPPEDLEEGEVEEVDEIVTQTGDVLVVEEQAELFTSDSAQRLIHDIMVWNGKIDIIRKKLNVMEKEMKNMIDVFGRIYIAFKSHPFSHLLV
ncbi:hypothetical protein AB205_0114950 [Aquarana catesbeiana]|uniref:Uncharacterized protein n=1 Tax=Aquarana catesbeiana TaxID=8400 RepID=A0A2G9R6F1_AQUCT|nr:hypothetical protein AB205_0114950 [Aquarana catesbeiana]